MTQILGNIPASISGGLEAVINVEWCCVPNISRMHFDDKWDQSIERKKNAFITT